MGNSSSTEQPARIFISYKRNADPDEQVALQAHAALSQQHTVFIDQKSIPLGLKWAARIEAELGQADFVIVFLSPQSVSSEMVQGEIETAYRLAKERGGRPVILPVRLNYREPLPYPLSAWLNPIQQAQWAGAPDTARLIEDLLRAVAGGELVGSVAPVQEQPMPVSTPQIPQPLPSAPLELPGGTVDLQSAFYVERAGDRIALAAIQRQGVTLTIKGPRQVGKSSLLSRVKAKAAEQGKLIVSLDFQQIDRSILKSAERFFRDWFCRSITRRLKAQQIEDRADEYWATGLGNRMCCTLYFEEHLLPALNRPLVLAMDEVDAVFDTDFRTDFFGMLRSWHNSRADMPLWKQLDLALVTSTEPYQFVKELTESPFNVGEVIEPEDYTLEQVADLNRRHGSPLNSEQERQLMALLGGHPFLIRRALYLVSGQRASITDILDRAKSTSDRALFGDHLSYYLFRLHNHDDLINGLREVIRKHACSNPEVFFRLRGAGLVRREGRDVLPRCQLYADYFQEYLNV